MLVVPGEVTGKAAELIGVKSEIGVEPAKKVGAKTNSGQVIQEKKPKITQSE